MARPVTLLTGASAGIGAELARVFARNGHELVLVARRDAQLKALAEDIAGAGATKPHVLPLDLGRPAAVSAIETELQRLGAEPAFVVNNAGFGLRGPAAELDPGEQLAMIDVNVRALTALSLRWVDSIARHRGGILNVASIAAFMPGPDMAVYHATKAYVLSFTESLHAELAPKGVRVTALCPGPVHTEFQARAGIPDDYFPEILAQPADRVAREGYEGLMRGRRVVIPGFANKAMALLLRFVPHGLLLWALRRRQRS